MPSNVVETILKLRGSREFEKGAKGAARSILGIGEAGEEGGKKAGLGWKGVAQWAGGAAAIGGATAYMKSAASTTTDLAKSTLALSRTTGMDTQAASAWAATLRVRNIDTNKFNVGMVALSRQMQAARAGNEKAKASFDALGIGMDTIRRGDTQAVLMGMADGLAAMENPAQKTAIAQQMLGRQGQALLPMLNSGTAALQDQLNMASEYGATLDGDATDAVKDQIAAQREWDMAMLGLKTQMGTGLLPALTQVAQAMAGLVHWLQPVLSNSRLMQGVIVGLVFLFGAMKLATFAATLSQLGLSASFITTKLATLGAALAMAGFNAAMLLIPLAIIAVVAGVIVLYKKWAWFRNLVNGIFNWVKSNWRTLLVILTGPFGAAVLVIVRNFDKIKAGVRSFIDWIKRAFESVKGAVQDVIQWIGDRINDVVRILESVGGAISGVIDKLPGGGGGLLGMFQGGGHVSRTGPYLVGEQGPEIVTLRSGSTVYPNSAIAPVGGRFLEPRQSDTVITKVYLDRRQIAEAVGSYTRDKKARR